MILCRWEMERGGAAGVSSVYVSSAVEMAYAEYDANIASWGSWCEPIEEVGLTAGEPTRW